MKSFRQNEIIRILEQEKTVNTIQLSQRLQVSVETIRRDFNQLEKCGILKKVYGGAEYLGSSTILWPSLKDRQGSNQGEKRAIAAEAIKFISDDCTIALDAGTTLGELCKFIPMRSNLTVICSDVYSAELLVSSGVNRVYMMGGFLTEDGTSNGDFSKDFFANISEINTFVCSCDGIDIENGITSKGLGINELKRQYIRKAKRIILLADHSKFLQKGFYKVSEITNIDILITDRNTPSEILSQLEALGINVVVADAAIE